MKNTLFIIITVIIFALCASDVLSNQNYGIRNPAIEYTTVPPSSYENTSYQNPNTTTTNGNSIVTGNVRHGARFQGEVPYRSASSFSSANLGTSTLNSFMRDSAGSEDFARYRNANSPVVGSYQPYQLQSETVTTMSNVRTGITNPSNTRIDGNTQRISDLQMPTNRPMVSTMNNSIESPASRQIYYPETSSIQNQYDNSSELRLISPRVQQNEQTSTAQKFRDSNPEIRATNSEIDGALQARINSELLRYNSVYIPDPRGYEIAATSEFFSPSQDETPSARYPVDITNEGTAQGNLQQNMNLKNVDSDVLRQIKSQLSDLTQSIDDRLQTERYDSLKADQTHHSSLVSRDSSSEYQATSTKGWLAPSNENQSYPDSKSYLPRRRSASPATSFSDASRGSGPNEAAGMDTQAKFNEYYLAGERYLKAGRYYEAVDSFAIAAIYKPNSSFCFAGQGHALFATGQYISSALLIIRAIELEPEYIQTDINLMEIAGGNAQLENKIAQLQQLIQNNPASGLRFLLGYVYFKTGRIVEAKQITDSLYQEMSKSPAALSLKIAVDLKLKNQ